MAIYDRPVRLLIRDMIAGLVSQFVYTLIVTEGFGLIPMAHKTFDLLSRHGGAKASMSGTTQIRAGVIRPEIIIPLQPAPDPSSAVEKISTSRRGIASGDPVRVIREPYFGQIGGPRWRPTFKRYRPEAR